MSSKSRMFARSSLTLAFVLWAAPAVARICVDTPILWHWNTFVPGADVQVDLTPGRYPDCSGVVGETRSEAFRALQAAIPNEVEELLPVINDDFANAITLAPIRGTTSELYWVGGLSIAEFTTAATLEGGEPVPSCTTASTGKSVWFRYAPVRSANGSTDVLFTTEGSVYNTVLAVYRGSTLGNLTELACDDAGSASGAAASISFTATDGTTYYIQVSERRHFGASRGGLLHFSMDGIVR